jgi:hypothetical protein
MIPALAVVSSPYQGNLDPGQPVNQHLPIILEVQDVVSLVVPHTVG